MIKSIFITLYTSLLHLCLTRFVHLMVLSLLLLFFFIFFFFFFFNDTATTEIYTLSLHDALPILFSGAKNDNRIGRVQFLERGVVNDTYANRDRKSTRLNSSHPSISYAVFCLKKKKKKKKQILTNTAYKMT